jgi:heme o synthase
MIAHAEAVARAPGLLRDLLSLTKPRVTALVLLTAAGGMYLAPKPPALGAAALALAATALLVGAANTLNCYLERDSDRYMARTRERPLPAGRLEPRAALLFGLTLAALSLPALFSAGAAAGLLGLVALTSYVLVYTPLKQKSPLALPIGAVPGAIPPLLGYAAATGRLDAPGLALFAVLFFWQLPHFLAIALYRKADYARAGIKVLPAVKGDDAARWRIPLYTAALVAATLALYPLGVAGPLYLVLAALLGAAFFAAALFGLRPQSGPRWARGFFFGSMIYLTALFGALALDAV